MCQGVPSLSGSSLCHLMSCHVMYLSLWLRLFFISCRRWCVFPTWHSNDTWLPVYRFQNNNADLFSTVCDCVVVFQSIQYVTVLWCSSLYSMRLCCGVPVYTVCDCVVVFQSIQYVTVLWCSSPQYVTVLWCSSPYSMWLCCGVPVYTVCDCVVVFQSIQYVTVLWCSSTK
jgi:hypothetical protein